MTPKFIKLTRVDGDAMLLNTILVFAFAPLSDKTTAIFEVGREQRSFTVKETIPEILALIEKP